MGDDGSSLKTLTRRSLLSLAGATAVFLFSYRDPDLRIRLSPVDLPFDQEIRPLHR